MKKKKPKTVTPIEINPTVLIVPPHITSYLYKMGYRTHEQILVMISNLVTNGR